MKHIVPTLVLALSTLLTGCGKSHNEHKYIIYSITHNGHNYLLYQNTTRTTQTGFTHDPDCPCLKK